MSASSSPRHVTHDAAERGVSDFALTPFAQAALFGLNAMQTNLRIWRGVSDSMRASMRAQQDAMLQLFLNGAVAPKPPLKNGEDAEKGGDAVEQSAADLLTPVFAARRAYAQMSGAMLEAQRETLAALMRNAQPR